MQFSASRKAWVLLLAAWVVGCGGGGTPVSKSNSTVTQVTVAPSVVSVVAGQVTQLIANAVNSNGGTVSPLPTFTYNSTNTTVATVSPSGLVCGGVWDSFFIVCNGVDNLGNPITGSASITASALGVSSTPIQVTVHPAISSIVVEQAAGCFSNKTTHQFTAHACSLALPHDASGPCSPNGREITPLIGPFSWSSTNSGAGTVDSNGLATAGGPGLAGIIAAAGSVSSPAVDFRSCMPVEIRLHINEKLDEAVTMAVAATQIIQADMVDENGVTTNSAPVGVSNNNTQIATLSGTTLTAVSSGGSGLVASCTPPACGGRINLPVYSNLFSVTVSGASGPTFVYATTTFAPPSGTTPTMIPIDTSKSPIVAGTAINLPGPVNSMIFAPGGAKAYLGTGAGIASLDTASNTVALLDPFVGKALAVSPDGSTAIFSNAANAPDPITGVVGPIQPVAGAQRLVVLSATNHTIQSFVLPGAVAASFTADGFKAFVAANNGNVYVFSNALSLQTISLGGTNRDVTSVASGPLSYFANSAGLEIVGTCNNAQQPAPAVSPFNSTTLQLLGATQNANLIVAMDSTGVDVLTATFGPLTTTFPFTLTAANCAPPATYSNQFIDFGLGPITAHQLLVPGNGTGGVNGSHIVVLPAGTNNVLVAVPGTSGGAATIPLTETGATEPLSGGMTLDGNTVWVGVAGSNTVDQIILTNSASTADALQIPTSFKKSDGVTPAPPNIVGVKPH